MVKNTLNVGQISEGFVPSRQEEVWIFTNIFT